MKNYVYTALMIIFTALVLSSCKDNNPVDDTNITFKSASAEFYGDIDWINIYYNDLYLYDKSLTNNQDGSGVMIYLALNCENTDIKSINSGTYLANTSTSSQKFTFERGAWKTDNQGSKTVIGSFVGIVKNGKISEYRLIASGSITVNQNGNYFISGTVGTDNNMQYKINFSGGIPFTDMVVPLPTTLTKGEVWYWGNIYNNNLNLYSIRLASNNVNISDFSGSGDAMQIEIYTPSTANTGIPSGTYPLKKISDNQANSSLAGEYNQTDNADYGTVYYTADKLYMSNGTISITNKGNNLYNLDFNFTDDYYGYSAIDKFDITLPLVGKAASGAPKQIRMLNSKTAPMQRVQQKGTSTRFDRYLNSNKPYISEMNKR